VFVVFYDVHLDLISCMSTKEFLMSLNYILLFNVYNSSHHDFTFTSVRCGCNTLLQVGAALGLHSAYMFFLTQFLVLKLIN
jgi:hypothetical protein